MERERLSAISGKELIAVLIKLGFVEKKRTATSHRRFVHPDGRRTTVPLHPGQDIGRGLLRKILRDIQLNPEEFLKYL